MSYYITDITQLKGGLFKKTAPMIEKFFKDFVAACQTSVEAARASVEKDEKHLEEKAAKRVKLGITVPTAFSHI